MNLSRVASGRPQYSRNITGSGRFTAIWPISPGFSARAVAVDHRHGVARAPACRSRRAASTPSRRAGAEHQIAFGLAVELVDGEAEGRACPIRSVSAPSDSPPEPTRAQLEVVAAARARRRAQHAQRGRRDEGVAHAGLAPSARRPPPDRTSRTGAPPPARRDAGSAAGTSSRPPAQAQSAGVQKRSPGLREELMRQLDAGQMAEQHAMRVQRALRLAGGAGGVDHHRRIVGGVSAGVKSDDARASVVARSRARRRRRRRATSTQRQLRQRRRGSRRAWRAPARW